VSRLHKKVAALLNKLESQGKIRVWKEFEWPLPFDNGLRLKDMLEDEVDEKYYISSDKVQKLLAQLDWQNKDKVCCDMTVNNPKFKDVGNCIKARYDAGISNQRSEGIGVIGIDNKNSFGTPKVFSDVCCSLISSHYKEPPMVIPCLTPDRAEKRQNGRRFKDDGEPMFTLTGQDRHGVMCIDPQGRKDKNCIPSETCPTLRAQSHGNEPCILQKVGCIGSDSQGNRVYSTDGIASAQCGEAGGLGPKTGLYLTNYRIRKLTPKECWLLMGFDSTDIDKCIEAGISNTQLYKMAGNSIVVNVLEEIYKRLMKD
jgi:DNA (cytosine-5)-methyltransferase 1